MPPRLDHAAPNRGRKTVWGPGPAQTDAHGWGRAGPCHPVDPVASTSHRRAGNRRHSTSPIAILELARTSPQTAAASHPELALSAGGGGASSPAGKEPHDTRGVTQAGRTRARRLIPHSPTIPMARGAGPRQGVVTRVLRGAPGAPNNRALCLTPQSRLHRRSSDQQATAPPRLRQSQKTERKKRLHHASRSCFPLARDIPQRLECHWAGA